MEGGQDGIRDGNGCEYSQNALCTCTKISKIKKDHLPLPLQQLTVFPCHNSFYFILFPKSLTTSYLVLKWEHHQVTYEHSLLLLLLRSSFPSPSAGAGLHIVLVLTWALADSCSLLVLDLIKKAPELDFFFWGG